jgi:hypothetical protein
VAPSAGLPNPQIVPERAGEAQAAVAQPVGAAPPAHNYNPEQDHEAQMDAAQPIGAAPHHHAPEQDHGSVMDSSSHQTDDDSADSADRVDDKCEKLYTNYVSKVEKSQEQAKSYLFESIESLLENRPEDIQLHHFRDWVKSNILYIVLTNVTEILYMKL